MTTFAKAFALFTGASFVGSLTQILKGKVTAVVLGPDGVGGFSQLVNIWAVFSVVASLGFFNGMIHHLAQYFGHDQKEQAQLHFSSNALFLVVFSTAIALVGSIFSPYISNLAFGGSQHYTNMTSIILLSIPLYVAAQTYKCVLNSTKSAGLFARAQMSADVISVPVLWILVYALNITGATIAYICLQGLYLFYFYRAAVAAVGKEQLAFRPMDFRWEEVRRNLAYGVSGIITLLIANFSILVISYLIIDKNGVDANGIYSTAIKIATVYIGGFTAVSIGHYFPLLSASKSNADIGRNVNDAIRLYMYILPPIIFLLIIGGDVAIEILFSKKFIPAFALLLIVLPADLFRVLYEMLAMPLLARRKLGVSVIIYCIWGALFVSFSYVLLSSVGLIGVAFAYLLSFALVAATTMAVDSVIFDFKMERDCIFSLAIGFILVFGAAAIRYFAASQWIGVAFCSLLFLMWFFASLTDRKFYAGIQLLIDRGRVVLQQRQQPD
jgi:O-antigen/teichoic acid export membrane protein